MATKADLIEDLANGLEGVTKKLAGEAIESIFESITKRLAGGERIQVPGFGTFQVSARAERQGRNPKTNQPMTIPASNNVRFKAGKNLKEAVNS